MLKKLASLFGYQLIRRYKADMSTSALTLANVFEFCQVDALLDVGANTGQFANEARQNGYTGKIHSFEPVDTAFKQLRQTSEHDQQWHIHQLALDAECKEDFINIAAATDLSSFRKPNEYGRKRFKHIITHETRKIQVKTIDSWLAENEISEKNIFLKMDTQGFDLEVFSGALNSLPRIVGIQSEIALRPLYDEMPDYLTALQLYRRYGYRAVALHPISRDKDLSIIEIDAIFVRTEN